MKAGRRAVAFGLVLATGGCGSFEGIGGAGDDLPAATALAVSPDRIVQAAAARIRVWARDATRTPLADVPTLEFFRPLVCRAGGEAGYLCDVTRLTNARVRFDEASARWFVLAAEPRAPGRWLLAVSQTQWPELGWWLYAFATGPAEFGAESEALATYPDFPGLGVGANTVLLTGNLARPDLGLAPVEQSALVLLDKASLLAGRPVAMAYFHPPASSAALWLLQPSHHAGVAGYGDSGTQVAAAVNVLSARGTTLRLQVLSGVPGGVPPPVMTRYEVTPAADAPFRSPPAARQPGGPTLALGDQRVRDVAVRNGQLWVALHQGCFPPDDLDAAGAPVERACARYLSVLPGRPVPLADLRLRERRQYYYLPAIALDTQGNLLSTVTRSSADELPSMYLTGRRLWDEPPTLRTPRLVRPGTTPVAGRAGPWGEASGAAAEPSGVGGWFSSAYPAADGAWGTWNATVHETEYPE